LILKMRDMKNNGMHNAWWHSKLTSHKVCEVVFKDKSRTKSFLWIGSAYSAIGATLKGTYFIVIVFPCNQIKQEWYVIKKLS
jgi:hypothetical protein